MLQCSPRMPRHRLYATSYCPMSHTDMMSIDPQPSTLDEKISNANSPNVGLLLIIITIKAMRIERALQLQNLGESSFSSTTYTIFPIPSTFSWHIAVSIMYIKNFLLAPLIAVGVSNALPQPAATQSPSPGGNGVTFSVMALRSASDIHFAHVSAAKRSVFLKLPDQCATCDGESDGTATFYRKDGGLFLYSVDKPVQQLFVDRSGMGK